MPSSKTVCIPDIDFFCIFLVILQFSHNFRNFSDASDINYSSPLIFRFWLALEGIYQSVQTESQ